MKDFTHEKRIPARVQREIDDKVNAVAGEAQLSDLEYWKENNTLGVAQELPEINPAHEVSLIETEERTPIGDQPEKELDASADLLDEVCEDVTASELTREGQLWVNADSVG